MDSPMGDGGEGIGQTRGGRRSNGLTATAYDVLTQCEPQIADALLQALATAGIAAYVMPYEGSIGGYLEVHPPVRPLARVWVNSAAMAPARELLAARYAIPAEPPAVADDAAWQEIVASLRRPGPQGPIPWPDAENVTQQQAPSTGTDGPHAVARPPATAPSAPPERPATFPDDPDDEHFVPEPPPPVPVPTGPSAYGIAALIAGSIVLLVSTMAGDQVSPTLLVLAIAAIVGGFVTLVARMRAGPPTDSGSDDGAVI
jgi:hypothetical protein